MKLADAKAVILKDIETYEDVYQKNKARALEHYEDAEYEEAEEDEVRSRDALIQMGECVRILKLLEQVELPEKVWEVEI